MKIEEKITSSQNINSFFIIASYYGKSGKEPLIPWLGLFYRTFIWVSHTVRHGRAAAPTNKYVIMKLQLDQNGNAIDSLSDMTWAKGILLLRRGKKMHVDVGYRVTPYALFSALGHLRAVTSGIFITSAKSQMGQKIPFDTALSASEACFHLGNYLLSLIEQRSEIFHTKDLSILTQEKVANLPVGLQGLSNLKMQRMPTAQALSMLDENAMANTSFIVPSTKMSFGESGYRVRKLPKDMIWPSEETYLPLAFSQLLPAPYAPWYNSLCHVALCVRRPLLHRAQIKLTINEKHLSVSNTDASASPLLERPIWFEVTRILYPLAAPSEKPMNFRLLIYSLIDETDKNIL